MLERKSIDASVKDAETLLGRKPGWAFIEDGEEITAGEAPAGQVPKTESAETKSAETPVETPSVEAGEQKAETEAAEVEEVLEFDNEADYLKAAGVYSNWIKTMADVEKELDYRLRRIEEKGGYDRFRSLFVPGAVESAEAKVDTLKAARKAESQLIGDEKAVERARELGMVKPEQRKEETRRALDRLSQVEKESLADPSSADFPAVLEKFIDYKTLEKQAALELKLDRLEYRLASDSRNLDEERIKKVVAKRPYLRKVLANPGLSMEEKVDLLASIGGDPDELVQAGRDQQARLHHKRQAQLRLNPTKATRQVSGRRELTEEQLNAELRELRQARSANPSDKVAPKLKKLLGL